jgi:hypothetical protein
MEEIETVVEEWQSLKISSKIAIRKIAEILLKEDEG